MYKRLKINLKNKKKPASKAKKGVKIKLKKKKQSVPRKKASYIAKK